MTPRTEAGKRAVADMTSERSTDPYLPKDAVRLVRAIEDEAARLPDSRLDIAEAEPVDREAEVARIAAALAIADPKTEGGYSLVTAERLYAAGLRGAPDLDVEPE